MGSSSTVRYPEIWNAHGPPTTPPAPLLPPPIPPYSPRAEEESDSTLDERLVPARAPIAARIECGEAWWLWVWVTLPPLLVVVAA